MTASGDKNTSILRSYLLGELTSPEKDAIELRLMSDGDFAKEHDLEEDEIISDYVADSLSLEERKQAQQFFFRSTVRKEQLKFALALYQHQKGRTKPWWKSNLAIAAAVLLVASVGFVFWWSKFRQSDVDQGLAALNAAYREQRPVEARLSDLQYAAHSSQRGPVKTDYVKRDRAGSLLATAVNERRDASAHHALGEYYIAGRQFEKALDQLKTALTLDPKNARIHSDLGAALLEQGKTYDSDPKTGQGVQKFAESLEHLNRALALDISLREAVFNRALVHWYLALFPQAEADWRRYLELDGNSEWATEVRQHLQLIERRKTESTNNAEASFSHFVAAVEGGDEEKAWAILSTQQNRSGNVVVEQLIEDYLDPVKSNRAVDLESSLKLLTFVGDLSARRAKDQYYADLARYYRSMTSEQRKITSDARALMKEGHAKWGQVDATESLMIFTNARNAFLRAGNREEAEVAEYWMSFSYTRQHAQEESIRILDPLINTCEARAHLWLEARCLYQRSAIEFRLNQHSRALDFALRSATLADSIDDSVGLLNAVSSLIEYYRYLGNYQKSLSQIQRALPIVRSISLDPVQASRHYALAAVAFAAIKYYDAAEDYQREALRLAQKTNAEAALSYNYAFLGLINGKLGNFDEALKNVASAFSAAQPRPNDTANQLLIAYASLQKGNIERQMGQCGQAVASYDKAIESYDTLDFTTHLFQAHKGKLYCYISQNNDELARHEILITLGYLEKYRDQIREEDNRNTFFDIEQNVFDLAMDFEVTRTNDLEQAFTYLQTSQSRSLLDLLMSNQEAKAKLNAPELVAQTVSKPLSTAQIRLELPREVEILQYAVLEKRLLIWVITTDKIQVRQTEIAQRDFTDKLARYLKIISNPPTGSLEDESRLSKELYTILIGPVEDLLDRKKQLCIIPDKSLNFLSFASLMSPSGKYLIEDHILSTSQSPSVFLLSSAEAARRTEAKPERVLSVGNPQFDPVDFPDLANLPAAAEEAKEIAELFDSRVVLTGPQATPAAVKSNLNSADVVQLAMHSALDNEAPLRSKLIMAKDTSAASSESMLYAYEIYNLKLTRPRLVVLSACQTGAEQYYGGEGMMSLARAFIAAGVPQVVASLWPVDSDATKQLMVSFHKHRKEGRNTAESLQEAQKDLIKGANQSLRSVYYWGSFTLIGGYASF